MEKQYLTTLSLILAAILIVSPIAYTQSYDTPTTIKGEVYISPTNTYLDIAITKKLPPNISLDDLEGNITYNYDPNTGYATLNGGIMGNSSSLQGANLQGTFTLQGSSTINGEIISSNIKIESGLEGEITNGSNYTSINLYYGKNNSQTIDLQNKTLEAHQDSHLHLTFNYTNETSTTELETKIDSNSYTIGNENTTTQTGIIEGPLFFSQNGYEQNIYINVTYNYTLYHTNNTIELNATITLSFEDYMSASNVYFMIEAFLQYLNTNASISVTPPTQINPAIVIQVEYTGALTGIGILPGMGFPQIPGMPINHIPIGTQPTEITSIMPTISPATLPEGNISYSLDINTVVNDGELVISINGEATIPPEILPSQYLLNNAQATVTFDKQTNTILIDLKANTTTPEPFTPFAFIKEALKITKENISELQSFKITLIGEDGVQFLFNGEEKSTVIIDESNISYIDTLAIVYNGTIYYGFNSPINILKENTKTILTPYTQKIVLNTTSAHLELPFPQAILSQPLIIQINTSEGKLAELTLLRDTYIDGTMDIAYHSPDTINIPEELDVQPVGKAITIHNITGSAKLMIKAEGSGQLALLVIHDNGTTELLTNITVENGYIIAKVSTQSTYIPVVLAAPSENTTTTTTTKTTPENTTTTNQETTTSQKTTTTGSGTSQGETTTSGPAAPSTSSGSTSEETGKTSVGLIAGIIIVIIIVAFLVLKFMK